MTDPLDALHTPVVPVDPDPVFAARLLERLRRALLQPTGDIMTTQTADSATMTEARLHSLTPYICVDDGQHALRWYAEAFGARPRSEPIVMEDGRLGHAELAIGDSVLMLADEWPELGLLGPTARGGPSQSLYLTVADVDAVFTRAVELGAQAARPVADSEYGRNGAVVDPFGHRWMITTGSAPATAPRQGGIGYASVWTPDVDRAATFYGNVLDWHFAPGSDPRSRRVEGLPHQHLGLWGGQGHPTMHLVFAVEDIQDTIHRIRAAGGTAEEPSDDPHGLTSMCTDDQGLAFAIYQGSGSEEATSSAGETTTAPEPAVGEVAYLTLQVPDSIRTRAFFSSVLGWEFSPGRVPDGWGIRDKGGELQPMVGLHGGFDHTTVVPMYAVDDIATAVTRVQAAGGTATTPEREHYGIAAECTDDQGAPFGLGQF